MHVNSSANVVIAADETLILVGSFAQHSKCNVSYVLIVGSSAVIQPNGFLSPKHFSQMYKIAECDIVLGWWCRKCDKAWSDLNDAKSANIQMQCETHAATGSTNLISLWQGDTVWEEISAPYAKVRIQQQRQRTHGIWKISLSNRETNSDVDKTRKSVM